MWAIFGFAPFVVEPWVVDRRLPALATRRRAGHLRLGAGVHGLSLALSLITASAQSPGVIDADVLILHSGCVQAGVITPQVRLVFRCREGSR
jgi:hypothetical protein